MSHQDDTIPIDPSERRRRDAGPALGAPNFDARSVQSARAAVPLPQSGDTRWDGKLPWVVVALVAGMIGGLLGILALSYYAGASERADTPPAPAAAQPAASQPATETGAAARPQADRPSEQAATTPDESPTPADEATPAGAADGELRGALSAWIDATNARDLERQMSFYDSRVNTFYLARDASREAVRAEKAAVISRASKVDVRADPPQISLAPDGRTATMRFRKQFNIEGGSSERRGAVLQELRWRRTPRGWKIVGERDLRVVD